MFSRAIDWWDELNEEKKTLVHFVAHILEFAIIIAAAVVVVRIHTIQQARIEAQDIRLEEYYAHLAKSSEQMRLYGEWLSVVRAKEGLIDSLAKTTGTPGQWTR